MRQGDGISSGWGSPGGAAREGGAVWVHVPPAGELRVFVCSEEPVRYQGHWVGGQMSRCRPRDCGLCARGVGAQQRWVLCVYEPVGRFRALLEVGRYAAAAIEELAKEAGHLRMLGLVFRRDGQDRRSRVVVERDGACGPGLEGLPESWDVARLLREIWGRQGE